MITVMATELADGTKTVVFTARYDTDVFLSCDVVGYDEDMERTFEHARVAEVMTASGLVDWFITCKRAWRECHGIKDVRLYIM